MNSFNEIIEFTRQNTSLSNTIIILFALVLAIIADIIIKKVLNCVVKKIIDSLNNTKQAEFV